MKRDDEHGSKKGTGPARASSPTTSCGYNGVSFVGYTTAPTRRRRSESNPAPSAPPAAPWHHPAVLHFFSGLGPNLPEVVLDLKGPQALKCRSIASPGCRLAPATRIGTQCAAARPSSRGWWQPGDRSWTWASRLALARVGTWDDRTGHAPMIDLHAGREKVCQQRGRWTTEPSRHPRLKTEGPPDRSPAPDG